MIPDAGNRTFTIKLENLLERPNFKYFTTDVMGWAPTHNFAAPTDYAPMVWNPWKMLAVSAFDWIEAVVKQHSDDTDATWSVTYKGLNNRTIDVRVEQP